MSQVARGKKMFDDVSSFSEEDVVDDEAMMQHKVKSPPMTHSAQHVDAAVFHLTALSATAGPQVDSDDDPNAFVPKSASSFQQVAEPEGAGGEDAGHVTMVARVSVSLTPKDSPRVASPTESSAQAQVLVQYPTVTMQALKQPKSAAAGNLPWNRAVLGSASAYSAPAAVSQRQSWPEEVEAAVSPQQAGADRASLRKGRRRPYTPCVHSLRVNERGGGAAATGAEGPTPAQHPERVETEAGAFATMENREEVKRARRSPDESDDEMYEQYTPASMSRATAAQIECSGEEYAAHYGAHAGLIQGWHSELSKDKDFPFASYIFPRLNSALANYQGTRTAVAAVKQGDAMPPNAVETCCAYLMVTDIRVAIYLVVLFVSVALVLVSIPTSQLDIVGAACLTYWGYKNNCDNSTYTIPRPLYPTPYIRRHLGVGAAFSIITLLVLLVNFAAAVIVVCCLKAAPHTISFNSRIVLGALGCVGVFTQLISWAVVARIYNSGHYAAGELAYGAGFGLNLSSWVMHLLGVTLVFAVPSHFVNRHQQRG
ncbi:amastin-like protein [Leishmania donovani]|uniref:Amastin surface glycofamily protein n=1 Tax=Leishmania donovani TaxID=5661 RepID=A0A3S7X1I0_LEIDO|nr:amastin-like protein [Leishmania donovani]AYU80302.1 amastin-like protein [Leishmania donovani]TPP54284.1 Amastin surface glycofamily protein [Leishmania donovani]CBZ35556.1 amastin-like protein [Leishmania donovani]